jgi:hypothetical protein
VRWSWVPIFILAIVVGSAATSLVPRGWGHSARWGLCVGAALYFVAFQRYLVVERPALLGGRLRWVGREGVLAPVLLRAGAFLGLVWLMLYVVYGPLGDTDVRWPLVTLAAWSVVETTLERRRVTADRPTGG